MGNDTQNAIQRKEVWSADWTYLVMGIVAGVLIAAIEYLAIINYSYMSEVAADILMVVLQMPVILLLGVAMMADMFIHRAKFTLYFCRMDGIVNMGAIKARYHIAKIDNHGMLLVEEKDIDLFRSWKFLRNCNMKFIEEEFFAHNKSNTISHD